jgi:hypothetical protein
MWKRTILISAITLVASLTCLPLDAAEFKHSGCGKAAEMKFPTDRVARKEFKHWCKDQWKIYKASQKERV